MEIPFHSGVHLQIWYATPLRSLNPHLFLVLVVALTSLVILLVYQKRQKQQEIREYQRHFRQILEDYLLEKQRKEKLVAYLADLRLRRQRGEVEDAIFASNERDYLQQLKLVQYRLQHMEADINALEEEEEV